MPVAQAKIHPNDFPLTHEFMSIEDCRRYNPQRFEFEQLSSVLHFDKEANLMVGHRRVEANEFWTRGHLPDRPLFPGVLMIESLAQLGSIHAHLQLGLGPEVFIGFGGVDAFRFRGTVEPPANLWIAGSMTSGRASGSRVMMRWSGQILREDGELVCEGTVLGVGL